MRRLSAGLGLSRGRLGAGLALALVAGVVAVLVISARAPSTPGQPADPGPAASVATVQWRDLTETDTESGTVGYGDPQTVFNRLNGTITSLPSVGEMIHPGDALYTVDGEPVILMDGTTPAYRDLDGFDGAGADVLQLNRNLVNLGFNPDGIVVDDVWQVATTAGVDALQASEGESETGAIPLGRVVFLPGDQLISSVEATIGGTGGGGGSAGSSATGASLDATMPAPEFVTFKHEASPTGSRPATTATTATTTTASAASTTASTTSATVTTRPTATARATTNRDSGQRTTSSGSARATLAALIALVRAQTAQLKAMLKAEHAAASSRPASGGSSGADSSSSSTGDRSSDPDPGGGGASAEPILQTTSTKLVVTVDLAASSQSEAVLGEHVTVEMPAGNVVSGVITAVSRVAQTSSGSTDGTGGGGPDQSAGSGGSGQSSSTIPVTITLEGQHAGAGLDQAAVSVNFIRAQAKHVLSVPVTALLAIPGGGYAIQEASAPHKLIAVTTGLFAAGYVQVSGVGVYPGLQVTESQG